MTNDQRIRRLNFSFRHRDKATDVLSFQEEPRPRGGPNFENNYLGDIIISVETAQRQAFDRNHSLETELRLLIIHGLLHLLGYDHERDGGAMDRIERRLRRKGGLRQGLIERADPRRSSAAPRAQQRRAAPAKPPRLPRAINPAAARAARR